MKYRLLFSSFLAGCISVSAHASGTISSNPAAVNIKPGTGALQKYLEDKFNIQNNYGLGFDGAYIGDINKLFSGGIPNAERTTFNSSLLVELTADADKLMRWKGAYFDVQLLQINDQPTNEQAGSVQGYNSLTGARPLNRTQLYQIWYKQELLNKGIIIRLGKIAPTLNFNNVTKPVPLQEQNIEIPVVSSLLFTPLFVNASMLGVIPGYYNSAYGVTVNIIPVKQWYLSLGMYDGNMAQGVQTGLTGPTFNGSYFNIGETGFSWELGKDHKPGLFAVGAWHQTGLIQYAPVISEQGASGIYLFGSQRLWYKNAGVDNSGVSFFYQYGISNSSALPMQEYAGAGVTAFGLVPTRLQDSMGLGAAYSKLNQSIFSRHHELMYQLYYQAAMNSVVYLQPVITYIPTPGASSTLAAAWAGTLSAIILF